jgi:RES domain-containing protein
MPALYSALRPETAWLEAQQGFAFKAQPMTMCGYEVDCTDVADLTSDQTIEALGIDPGDLACPWEDMAERGETPPTWQLADRLIAGGAVGVIVPSFAFRAGSHDRNLVFWKWGKDLPHRVRVVDDHGRLPKDDRSWD